jgi:hypothetical protein
MLVLGLINKIRENGWLLDNITVGQQTNIMLSILIINLHNIGWLVLIIVFIGGATDSNIDGNDDAFKLKKLQGTTTEPNVVAAPSTLALMLLSFIGIAARRKKLKTI